MTAMQKTLYAMEHHAKGVSGIISYIGILAWEAGWDKPESSRGGANSWYTKTPDGRRVDIRYFPKDKSIRLIQRSPRKVLATFKTRLDVLKFFSK